MSRWRALLVMAAVLVASACGRGNRAGSNDSGDGDGDSSAVAPDCTTTSQCPEGAICRDEICRVATSCETKSDCGINRECDPEAHVCVECLVGNDCAEGETCLGNVCRDSCEDAGDCPKDQVCAENGYCAECVDDSGCPGDEHCSEGKCTADVCPARGTECDDEGNVIVCSERGDRTSTLICPPDESCGTEQGPAWCQSWVCVPGQSGCAKDENVAEQCSNDGLTVASAENCDETEAMCDGGECKPIICEPLKAYCQEGHVYDCGALGVSGTILDFCESYEYCDADAETCQLQICSPDSVGCSLGQVATCNAQGSDYESLVACAENSTCDGGTCLPIECAAGTRFCDGGEVRLCNPRGTGSTVFDACTGGEYCVESGTIASCSSDVCAAGEPYCIDDLLAMCNAEGSGPVETGQLDCTASGEVCEGGACRPVICSELDLLCENGNVHQCVSRGTSTQEYIKCPATDYCEEASATCQPRICEPDQKGCDDQVAKTCNSTGSDWLPGGTDCASLPGQTCDEGACKDIVCIPDSTFCDGTDVLTCNELGTGPSYTDPCAENRYCHTASPTFSYCTWDTCTAGTPLCTTEGEDEVATVCAYDGSGPAADGTNCTEQGLNCWDGSCNEEVCADSEFLCVDGNYHQCVSNGTDTLLFDLCLEDEYCSAIEGCAPDVCTASTPVCNGDVLTSCNSDGSGIIDGGTDCTLTGDACFMGACEPVVCNDGKFTCQGQDLSQCVDNGTRLQLLTTCASDKYCDEGAGGCGLLACDDGDVTCADYTHVASCRTDGAGYDFPGVACSPGEVCDDGACINQATACTFASKTWGMATIVDGASSAPSIVGSLLIDSDGADNLFVGFGHSGEFYVRRFDAALGSWSDLLEISEGRGTLGDGQVALSASENGAAMVVYEYSQTMYARYFNPIDKTWESEEIVAEDVYHVRLEGDSQGRFAVAWNVFGVVWASSFTSAGRWEAPVHLDESGHAGEFPSYTSLQVAMAVSRQGEMGIAFSRGQGDLAAVFWAHRSLDAGGAWSVPEEVLRVSVDNPYLIEVGLGWSSGDGSQAEIGFADGDSPPRVVQWTTGGGATDPDLLDPEIANRISLLWTPLDDVFFFMGDKASRRPAGGQFEANTELSDPYHHTSSITSPSGEVLYSAINDVWIHQPGTGWGLDTSLGHAGVTLTRLSACRAAALFLESGRIKVAWRE